MSNGLFNEAITVSENYTDETDIVLYQGDCMDLLRDMESESVDLVVSSPPYNLGKEYEDPTSLREYLAGQKPVIQELYRVLAPTGSICWEVGNFVSDGEVFPLDIFYYDIFKELGMKLRNRIIWRFGHGLHCAKRFSGRYEVVLWLTKTDNYVFNLDRVRIPQKYPGKRHYKGPNRGKPSGNPKGKNPSDVWDIVASDWEEAVWDIPNVKANHPEKTEHPCQFPVELVERCVLALTNEGDVVMDPYSGVGSTLIAAVKWNRRGVGAEAERRYVEIARERISRFAESQLRLRPMAKKVYEPKQSKLSQIPMEWRDDGSPEEIHR